MRARFKSHKVGELKKDTVKEMKQVLTERGIKVKIQIIIITKTNNHGGVVVQSFPFHDTRKWIIHREYFFVTYTL